MLTSERIVVTGGAGAIGSQLVERLIEMGSKPLIIDNFSSGHLFLVHPQAVLVEGSISELNILQEINHFKPTVIFHLAALFANQNSVDHPEKDLETNGAGTLRLLELAKRLKVRKFIYVSSSCVYGKHTGVDEDSNLLDPETPYAITKLLGEQYVRFYSAHHGLQSVIFRIFNSYGPGELPGKYRNVIPNFIRSALRGEPLLVTGTGQETRDFTYVNDIVSGLLMPLILPLSKDVKSGEIINLGSGRGTSISDLAKQVCLETGSQSKIEIRPKRNWDGIQHRLANVKKANELFRYTAKTSLNEGLKKTIAWLRKYDV